MLRPGPNVEPPMFIGLISRNQVLPKVVWEERVALAQLCSKVTMRRHKFIPKTAPSMITTPSTKPIPRPNPLITPNGIWIQSAVLPQYSFRTDRQMDRWSRRQVYSNSVYAVLIESDALIIGLL